MKNNARNNAVGTPIHPTKKQSEQSGMDKLYHVAMNSAKNQCRDEYGSPVPIARQESEESAESGGND